MELIADTNVWYDLASGARSVTDPDLRGTLVASPVTFIEITGKLTPHTYAQRRDAAKAVLDYASRIVDDPETYLALVWGLGDPKFQIDWLAGFRAVAQSKSLSEITGGVSDAATGVTSAVKLSAAEGTRQTHWQGFAASVADLIEEEIPGYKASRVAGKTLKRLRGEKKKAFVNKMSAVQMQDEIIAATYGRACLAVGQPLTRPSQAAIDAVRPTLERYARLYAQYLVACATGMAPQSNDWGDLEHFLYLDGTRAVVTQDKRWRRLATEVGLAGDVR